MLAYFIRAARVRGRDFVNHFGKCDLDNFNFFTAHVLTYSFSKVFFENIVFGFESMFGHFDVHLPIPKIFTHSQWSQVVSEVLPILLEFDKSGHYILTIHFSQQFSTRDDLVLLDTLLDVSVEALLH